ncbi:hypothetical protein ACHAPT_007284 [Fusarium lateritium]
MKVLLLLWASGALGGPCRPSPSNTISPSLHSTQSAPTGTDSASISTPTGVVPSNSHSGGDTSTGTLSTPSSWSTGSVSGTVPGQPSGTDTIPGPGNTDTIPGQPSDTDTWTGTVSVPSGSISQSGSTPGNTETGPSPSGTETGPSGPSGTETGPNPTGPSGTETGPNPTGTETGPSGPSGTETGPSGTETGPNPTGTETGPSGPSDTETGSSGTGTGPSGTETGSSGTETGPNPTGTETGPSGTETDPSGTETGPTQPTNSETGGTVTSPSGTETGPNPTGTETSPSGTETGPSGTETGPSGTETSPSPTGTETGPSGSSGTETGPSGTETGPSGTETEPNPTGPSGTETGPSGTETEPGPSNTETSSTETGPSGTETGPTQSGASDTETGPSGTETGPAPTGTETGPSGTETGPSGTETGPSDTETSPSATETGPSDTETGPTQPSNTETGPSSGPTSTSGVPTQTSTTDGPTAPPTTSATPSSSGSYASTVTVPPENWSPTCASGHPEWTSNTWITTTSEGSAEQTVVPVLVGSKECDDEGSGLILFGFPPLTGVWFKFPGFPGFSFPCIQTLITKCDAPPTSEKDGDDDDDNKSSTACSETLTATDCLVACTTYTGAEDALITPECTTTCTKTHTGCSVTGVTSTTTSAEGCDATGGGEECAECGEGLGYAMNGKRGRDGAGEDGPGEESSAAVRRWSKPESNKVAGNKVGNCVISNGVSIEFPQYPEGNDVFLYEKAIAADGNSPLGLIHRWYYWKRKNEGGRCWLALEGDKRYYDYFEGKQGSGREYAPSIDHVFEKSFLGDFWWSITPKGGQGTSIHGTTPGNAVNEISCDDLIYYGSALSLPFGSKQPSNPPVEDMTFITDVYKTYPGAKQNPGGQEHQQIRPLDANFLDDFIGVDAWTNEAKGFATTPRNIRGEVAAALTYNIYWQTMSLAEMEDHVNLQIEVLDKLYIGVTLANRPKAGEAMVRQNKRIYKALLDMDKHARDCLQDPAVKDSKWSFAERYKTFMDERFNGNKAHSINPTLMKAFQDMGPKILQDLKDAWDGMEKKINANPALDAAKKKTQLTIWKRKWDLLNKRYNSLLARYRSQPPAINVVWDWSLPAKRDDEDEGASCQIATTSSVATTFSTAVSTGTEPSATGLVRCETVDDCQDTKCDDGKSVACSTVVLLPGLKICQCEGGEASSTTSAPEPSSTGGGQGCLSKPDCEMDCEEGEEPSCVKSESEPNNPFGTCECRPKPTTSVEPTTTSTTSTTSSTTSTTSTTETPTPDPTPTAYCDIYAAGVMWYVEITRIAGWAEDGGDKLEDEEGGCGAMTGWYWYGETKKWGTSVSFNLPFFIKEGCVERAIVSAGGPKLECDSHPAWEVDNKKLGGGAENKMAAVKMIDPDEPAFPDRYIEAKKGSEEKYGTVSMEATYTPMSWGDIAQPTSTARL